MWSTTFPKRPPAGPSARLRSLPTAAGCPATGAWGGRLLGLAFGLTLGLTACGDVDVVAHELDASGRLAPRARRALQLDAEAAADVVSEMSGLTWRHPVAAVALSRDVIRGHLERRREQKLRVPRAAELGAEEAQEIDLLADGLLGFFAPEEPNFLYVADDVDAETQAVVLRHEMAHALVAQHVDTNLQRACAGARGGDASLALQATWEGQASLLQNGHLAPVASAPRRPTPRGDGAFGHVGGHARARMAGAVHPPHEVGRKLAQGDARAPLPPAGAMGLRRSFRAGRAESMQGLPQAWAMRHFPYEVGKHFVGTLAARTSLPQAIAETLARPPRTTREVLHPEVYARREVLPTLSLAALEAAFRPMDPFRSTVGEYVTALMLGGTAHAFDVAEGWRADAVLAEAATGNGYWASLWSDVASAEAFVALLATLDGEAASAGEPDVQRLGGAPQPAPTLAYVRCGRAVVVARGVPVGPGGLRAAVAEDFAPYCSGDG